MSNSNKEMQLFTVKNEQGFWWEMPDEFMPGALLFMTNGDEDILVLSSEITPVSAKVVNLNHGDPVYFEGRSYLFNKYSADNRANINSADPMCVSTLNVALDQLEF